MKKISVVILTYNRKSTLIKCLKALNRQTVKDFEVLVVDDNSTDGTLLRVKQFQKIASFSICILNNGTHNISTGRNIGILSSKSKYIAFIDDDAYAHKDWIKNIILEFKDGKASVVYGDTIPVFRTNLSYSNSIVYETIRNLTRTGVWKIEGCNFAFDKTKLDNPYFNKKFKNCDDIEFFTRVGDKSKFRYNPKIKVKHEGRDTLKKYLSQQYEYGKWETLFSLTTKRDHRITSLAPSILILLTIILSCFHFGYLFLIPALSLSGSLFVFFYKKPKIYFLPYLFLSLFIKIIGWGTGVISGILIYIFNPKFIKYLKTNSIN